MTYVEDEIFEGGTLFPRTGAIFTVGWKAESLLLVRAGQIVQRNSWPMFWSEACASWDY